MTSELTLRIVTGLFLVLLAVVSGSVRRKADREGGAMRDAQGTRLLVFLRLGGLVMMAPLLAWIVAPDTVRWAQWAAPDAARWAGVGLQAVMAALLIWMLRSLGTNISPTQGTREGHQLVTDGPYRWIRHPLYTFATLFYVGVSFTSALWWLLPWLVALWAALLWRTPREEANLVALFGDDYRRYQARTGRFIPRLFGSRGDGFGN